MVKTALPLLCSLMGVSHLPGWSANGEQLYGKNCRVYHGENGEGNPSIARLLKVELPHLASSRVREKSDADLIRVISRGSGKMKPVKGLSAKETEAVITFIRTLEE